MNSKLDLNNIFFKKHLISYIGNKRKLLSFVDTGIEKVKKQLNKKKLISCDGFAGSGVVSRLLKYHSAVLYSNDLENYSNIINKCYLSNSSEVDLKYLMEIINHLNSVKNDFKKEYSFIYENYAPQDDSDIKDGERVFYTTANAKILDTLKFKIYKEIPEEYRYLVLAPLITVASIHTNTSGVFKGFHKKDGLGCFGGKGEHALSRIKKEITLPMPIFSEVECEVNVFQDDINNFIKNEKLPEFDLVYYDPPYNQHPYGSNYFMLNIFCTENKEIAIQDGISGIAKDWNRSEYNKRVVAEKAMDDLIKNTNSKYILLSYNNEGIIPVDVLQNILEKYGEVERLEQNYNTYRGSRNLQARNVLVKELLWILKKKS